MSGPDPPELDGYTAWLFERRSRLELGQPAETLGMTGIDWNLLLLIQQGIRRWESQRARRRRQDRER